METDFPGPLLDRASVAVRRTLRAGVDRPLTELDRAGEGDAHAGLVDRKVPAVTGDVPVKLVKVGEAPELARGPVTDDVAVVGGSEEYILLADTDANAIADGFGRRRLCRAILGDAKQLETNADASAARGFVAGREVPVDAAADLNAFGAHGDRL